jgi:hypothetical protein
MIQTFKTDLEKASFVLTTHHDTPSEEIGGRLYVNVTETLSVSIGDDTIAYLVECYDEYINELNQ